MITRFTAAAVAAAGLYFNTVSLAAAAPRFTVLHHERLAGLALERHAASDGIGQHGARATRLRFQALGRAFDMALQPNDRLLANLGSRQRDALSNLELYRGSFEGRPETWARVSVFKGDLYALIWDGSELYAIEPAARLAGSLTEGDEDARESIAFRVSDVQGIFQDEAIPAGAKAGPYAALLSDLQADAMSVPARRLDLGLVADVEFTARNPDVEAELLLRANYVDGIYSEQLGLQINVAETQSITAEPDAFSSTDPTTLLASVRSYRERDAGMRSEALVHLYTGKQLDGNVVGIAYLDGLCDGSYGAGLTEGSSSVFHDALITAHEIGHNLGAHHDAEAGSPCESTPATYLMAAQLNGSDQFSQCSLEHISATIAHASCLAPAYTGDVRVSVSAAEHALLGDEVPVHVSIDNPGNEAGVNVVVTLQTSLGAELTASTTGAAHDCAVADGQVRCAIGALAAGAQEDIDVELTGTRTGTVTLLATAQASNDTNPLNNAAARSLELLPAVVLAVSVDPETVVLGAGDTAPIEVTVLNDSLLNATALNLDLSSPFELTELSFGGAGCTRASGSAPHYRCTLASLQSHVTQKLRAVIHAPDAVQDDAGISGLLSATASAAEPIAHTGTNSASAVVRAYSSVVDLASTIIAAPARVQAGAPAHIVVQLQNLGPDAARDALLDLTLASNLAVVGVADDDAACRVASATAVRCETATLSDGAVLEVDVEVVPSQPGSYSWSAAASHAGLDPNSANDQSRQTMDVLTAADSHPAAAGSAGGGGGGGASWLLLALTAIGLHRRRLRSPRA